MSKILLPEAIVRVRFFLPEEGGRNSCIIVERTPDRQTGYGCPMRVCGDFYDFRTLISENTTYILGKTYDLRVKFLRPELVLPKLREGMKVELWEGKTIASGHVEKIFANHE